MKKDYMSGSELRQYLHISTRKMKYLMDNNYITHINTGQATHKYKIPVDEARKFKSRMKNEVGFLSELSGMFPSKGKKPTEPMLKATPDNCAFFAEWLTTEWQTKPDALSVTDAAKLIGCQPKQIFDAVHNNKLISVKIGRAYYISKTEFILYAASPEKLSKPTSKTYTAIIRRFQEKK